MAHPSILDLHYDIDHNVTYASIKETALPTLDCAPHPPTPTALDTIKDVSQPPPPSRPLPPPVWSSAVASARPHLRYQPDRLLRHIAKEFAAVTLSTLVFSDDSDTDSGDWPELTLPEPYAHKHTNDSREPPSRRPHADSPDLASATDKK